MEIYGPLIYGYCRRQRLNEADASDVSQEVLTRLSTAINGFEYKPDKGGFRKWLGTITHNELARFYSKRRRLSERHVVSQESVEADFPAVQNDWSEHFQASLLQVALARIEAEFEATAWAAFRRVWIDDVPAKEVADQFAMAIEKIYVCKSRILKRLREEILLLSEDLPVIDSWVQRSATTFRETR